MKTTTMDRIPEASLTAMSAIGGVLSLVPFLSWPTLLTILPATIGVLTSLGALHLQWRRHKLQSQLEKMFEDMHRRDLERMRELEARLAEYEQRD